MLLGLSGRCAHLWIDWQGPQHPGDLGDEYSFLIGRLVLPDQFAHPSRPIAVAPSLPDLSVTGWLAGWHSTRANERVQRTSSFPGLIPLAQA